MSKTRESRWDGKLESLLLGTSSGTVLDSSALPQDEPLLILGYELNALNGLEGNGVFTGRNLDEQSQSSELELSQFDSMPLIQSQDDRERLPVAVHELL